MDNCKLVFYCDQIQIQYKVVIFSIDSVKYLDQGMRKFAVVGGRKLKCQIFYWAICTRHELKMTNMFRRYYYNFQLGAFHCLMAATHVKNILDTYPSVWCCMYFTDLHPILFSIKGLIICSDHKQPLQKFFQKGLNHWLKSIVAHLNPKYKWHY